MKNERNYTYIVYEGESELWLSEEEFACYPMNNNMVAVIDSITGEYIDSIRA